MGYESFINQYRHIAHRYPFGLAMTEGSDSCTHEELWNRAYSIACTLSDLSRGMRVGLHLNKSIDLVACMLGCWMRGLVFIPLDPALPSERLLFYIRDAQPQRILSRQGLDDIETHPVPAAAQHSCSIVDIEPDDGAYLMYSSGSTGTPKGILVSHRGLVSVLKQQIAVLHLDQDDRCLWFLSMQFDASISDIGVALLSGAELIIDTESDVIDALHKHRITYVDMPPVLLGVYPPKQLPETLTRVLIGGEPCPQAVIDAHRIHRRIILVYGPTEATICTSFVVCDARNGCMENSIGSPLKGVSYHIEEGELWICGETLALGYWNRPSLSSKWIVRDQTRYFRTGDCVVQHEDMYRFVGRMDRQFKLHGKLIAPEEIEMQLQKQPEVLRADVCMHNHRLFAFVESETCSDYSLLAATLSSLLPNWMIPTHGMILSSFPILPSGKIDRLALRAGIPAYEHSNIWCQMFAQVLQRPVQEHDHFFALGGDSIAVISLLVQAHKNKLPLTPQELRKHPTPFLLSRREKQETAGIPISELQQYVDAEIASIPASNMPHNTQRIYITGATGFLGRHIVSLLCARGYRPRVLVRGTDVQQARRRIAAVYRNHVDVVVGDLRDENCIERFIDDGEGLLFHCAASLSLGVSLEDIYDVNVRSCASLFRYPRLRIAYASTLAFLLTHDGEKGDIFERPSVLVPETRIFGAYAQSKWIAEQIALHRNALVVRFGLLVDDTTLPRFDWFVSFVRGLALLGCMPSGIQDKVQLDMTPLFDAAQSFVDLALAPSAKGIYHIAAPQSVSLRMLCGAMEGLGYPVSSCSPEDFHRKVNALDGHCVNVVRLAFHAAMNENCGYPELNMFLATGARFDDARIRAQLGREPPIPSMDRIQAVLIRIMEEI